MLIPTKEYIQADRRLSHLMIIIMPFLATLGAIAVFYLGMPLSLALKNNVGGHLGSIIGMIAIIPFIILPLVLPVVGLVGIRPKGWNSLSQVWSFIDFAES